MTQQQQAIQTYVSDVKGLKVKNGNRIMQFDEGRLVLFDQEAVDWMEEQLKVPAVSQVVRKVDRREAVLLVMRDMAQRRALASQGAMSSLASDLARAHLDRRDADLLRQGIDPQTLLPLNEDLQLTVKASAPAQPDQREGEQAQSGNEPAPSTQPAPQEGSTQPPPAPAPSPNPFKLQAPKPATPTDNNHGDSV